MTIDVADQAASDQELQLQSVDFITSGDQYLTFTLGEEHYGIDILVVNEIRGWDDPTLIPNSPEYVKGVINLRGTIVPIIDLRSRFQIGETVNLSTSVVIVIALENERVNRTMGFVVDTVSDVLNAEGSEIKAAPAFGGAVPPEYIEGIVNVGNNVVTLLNIEQLLSLDEKHVEH